jgi:hypothetical protein
MMKGSLVSMLRIVAAVKTCCAIAVTAILVSSSTAWADVEVDIEIDWHPPNANSPIIGVNSKEESILRKP